MTKVREFEGYVLGRVDEGSFLAAVTEVLDHDKPAEEVVIIQNEQVFAEHMNRVEQGRSFTWLVESGDDGSSTIRFHDTPVEFEARRKRAQDFVQYLQDQ